uniref:Ligated ion channel binding I - glutamate n=1 Tax=Polyphagotarsonemus latus TaxID=1204166 RepID=A0AAN0N7A3_9ACAR
MNSSCKKNIFKLIYNNMKYNNLYSLDKKKNKLTGLIGSNFQRLLDYFQICPIFINIDNFGTKFQNGSFNGVIGALVNGEADFFFKPLYLDINNEYSIPTKVLGVDEILISHKILNKKNHDEDDLTDFLVFEQKINILVFLCFFTVLMFLILFDYFGKKNEPLLQKISEAFKNIFGLSNLKGGFKKKIIHLFFILFSFIFLSIIKNEIKTFKVIVDTSTIITDYYSLKKSEKSLCVISSEKKVTKSTNSLKTTVALIFNDRISKGKLKYFSPENLLSFLKDEDCFYFLSKQSTELITRLSIMSLSLKNYWVNSKPYFESQLILLMSKKIKNQKRFLLNDKVTKAFEYGILLNVFKKIIHSSDLKYKTLLFENLVIFDEKTLKFKGLIGSKYQKLFDYLQICSSFVKIENWGTKFKNGSISGIQGALAKGEADLFFKIFEIDSNNDFSIPTKALDVEENFISHKISIKKINEKEDDLIEFLKFQNEINFLIFFCLIIVVVFLVLFDNFNKKNESLLQKISEALKNIFGLTNLKGGFKKRIIHLFFILFFFIFTSIITNGIKTFKVVVDTSSIITDVNSLLSSNKSLCLLVFGKSVPIFEKAPKGTTLNLIWEDRLLKGRKKLFTFQELFKFYSDYECFYVADKQTTNLNARIALKFLSIKNYWINLNPISQSYQVLFMSKKIDHKKRLYLDYKVTKAFEHGIMSNINKNFDDYLSLNKKTNRLTGLIGNELQKVIDYLQICSLFINEINYGKIYENGTADGALGLLFKGEADFYLKSVLIIENNEYSIPSNAINTEEKFISHKIPNKKKSDDNDDLIDFLKFTNDINFLIFLSLTIVVLSLVFFDYFGNKKESFYTKLSEALKTIIGFQDLKGGFKKKLVFLFFIFFSFVFTSIITNGIKTLKVIVDTSSIITDYESIITSDKSLCLLLSKNQISFLENSPKGTLLYLIRKNRLSKKKFKQFNFYQTFAFLLDYECFYIMNKQLTNINARIGFNYLSLENYWINPKPVMQSYQVFLMSKKISYNRKSYLNNKLTKMLEHGILIYIDKKIIELADRKYQTASKSIFYSLEEYIKKFTKFSSVQINSFYTLFLIFLSVYAIFFLLFIVSFFRP